MTNYLKSILMYVEIFHFIIGDNSRENCSGTIVGFAQAQYCVYHGL